jgi:hypothetical protein
MLPALTHVTCFEQYFQFCITNSVLPDVLRKTLVCPMPKIKSPPSISDYRPICLLPVFSKALEYVIFDQVDLFLESNKLYYPLQWGV